MTAAVDRSLKKNLEYLKDKLGIGITFDIIVREICVGERDAALIFIDGFVKDRETSAIMKSLMDGIPRGELGVNGVEKILTRYLPYFEVDTTDDLDDGIDQMLAGPMLLLVDGLTSAIVIDVREYPVRGIEEPDLERVTRGSHEGFVETAIFNTNLVRRRIRDSKLRFEAMQVGTRSKTDVFIGYIEDIADRGLVEEVKKRISRIKRDALPMGGKNLEEYILGTTFNPLPVTRYTERPDVAAAHLYEGHICIFVDTSPFAMIVPVTAWHFTQHAEEYFQNPPVGTYLRWVRTMGIVLSMLLIPVWYALVHTPNLPPWLNWLGPEEQSIVPLWLQFIILELGLDTIRIALVHTPNALATSLGIVGAILLGDLAVTVGIFVPETILYIAIVAIGTFGTPSLEFAWALRLFRFLILISTFLFSWIGLGVSVLVTFLIFGLTKSFGLPYLWPLVPFNGPALLRIIFRYPIPQITMRPKAIAKKKDRDVRSK